MAVLQSDEPAQLKSIQFVEEIVRGNIYRYLRVFKIV